MIYACYEKNHTIALKLLDLPNINLNHIDSDGETAFLCACQEGMIDVIEKMLCMSVNYFTVSVVGNTPLIAACMHGHEDVALQILSKIEESMNQIYFDQNECDRIDKYLNQICHDEKENALIWACRRGMIDVVKKLLSLGVDCNHINSDGETALTTACREEKEGIALELLGIPHIDYKFVTLDDQTALSLALGNKMNGVVNAIMYKEIYSDY